LAFVNGAFVQKDFLDTNALIDSTRRYLYSDSQKALAFTLQLQNEAKNTGDKSTLAYSHQLLGIFDEQIRGQ
jgi:hypothetical protein